MAGETDVMRVAAALGAPAIRYRSFGNEAVRRDPTPPAAAAPPPPPGPEAPDGPAAPPSWPGPEAAKAAPPPAASGAWPEGLFPASPMPAATPAPSPAPSQAPPPGPALHVVPPASPWPLIAAAMPVAAPRGWGPLAADPFPVPPPAMPLAGPAPAGAPPAYPLLRQLDDAMRQLSHRAAPEGGASVSALLRAVATAGRG